MSVKSKGYVVQGIYLNFDEGEKLLGIKDDEDKIDEMYGQGLLVSNHDVNKNTYKCFYDGANGDYIILGLIIDEFSDEFLDESDIRGLNLEYPAIIAKNIKEIFGVEVKLEENIKLYRIFYHT